jgi:hypothetical protein
MRTGVTTQSRQSRSPSSRLMKKFWFSFKRTFHLIPGDA